MGNVQHGSATHEVTIVTADEKGGFTNINVSISHYCIVLFTFQYQTKLTIF